MKKILVILIICLSYSDIGFAQQTVITNNSYKFNNTYDLSLAANGNQFLWALSWVHMHSVSKSKKFKVGYGLRFNSQVGRNLYFQTAPAKLTSNQTGPQVLFTEIIEENIDTLFIPRTQSNSLNVSINLQYTFKGKYDVGFNIDAVGFTFGAKTTGDYIAYQSPDNNTKQMASPTKLNLLLVSDNDIGSLNSELYFRYWFNEKWAIKTGASFAFSEYTSDNKLRLDNDRWRNKALMGMLGISFSPFNAK